MGRVAGRGRPTGSKASGAKDPLEDPLWAAWNEDEWTSDDLSHSVEPNKKTISSSKTSAANSMNAGGQTIDLIPNDNRESLSFGEERLTTSVQADQPSFWDTDSFLDSPEASQGSLNPWKESPMTSVQADPQTFWDADSFPDSPDTPKQSSQSQQAAKKASTTPSSKLMPGRSAESVVVPDEMAESSRKPATRLMDIDDGLDLLAPTHPHIVSHPGPCVFCSTCITRKLQSTCLELFMAACADCSEREREGDI